MEERNSSKLPANIACPLLDHIHTVVTSSLEMGYIQRRRLDAAGNPTDPSMARKAPQPAVPYHILELVDQFVDCLAKEVGVETI